MSPARSVLVVGGGPAGLYAAQLLKRSDSRRVVRLFERNGPDVATGWGVVFSADAVHWLRASDPATASALEDSLVHWDALEVLFHGRVIRAAGNSLWAMHRSALQRVLRAGCERAGVDLHFNSQWGDGAALDRYDLVVAADGARSRLREFRGAAFGTEIAASSNKHIWLGTPRLFNPFVFTFRESPYGLFWAYAYRIDDQLSTFNIECSEQTWRMAGLDKASESDSILLCERVFAEDLDGAPLLGNRSNWTSFQTARNRSWHDGKVVLVGDAAHTTHFTVGSGTRLAMEDATALTAALNEHYDVPAALARYQAKRLPPAQRMQAVALKSMAWFESIDRRMCLPHAQFAAALLMRSGQVTFDGLQKMDRDLTGRAVAALAGAAEVGDSDGRSPLMLPFAIRSLSLAGRVVTEVSADPASPSWSDTSTLGPVSLSIASKAWPSLSAECALLWRRLATVVSNRSRLAVQLRQGPGQQIEPLLCAADEAGIDAVEWILRSPEAANELTTVREAWPRTKPLLVRVPIEHCDQAEILELARRLSGAGCDVLVIPPSCRPDSPGQRLALSEAVRNLAGLPTLIVGVATADEANTLLLNGQADLCMPSSAATASIAPRKRSYES